MTTMEGAMHQSRIPRNHIKVIKAKMNQFSKEFEIEKIIKHRKNKSGQLQFLIKWLGYNSKHNLWLPTENLVGLEMFDEYVSKNGLHIT